jgi:RNA polymerase sigma-70 factor (ECF subfamily)
MKVRARSVEAELEIPDATVVAAVAAGDLDALGTLYDRYAPDLVSFVARIAGPEEAEDVVHTVFMRVLQRAAAFDATRPSARPWLFGFAVRVAKERKRAVRRWMNALSTLGAERPRSRPTTLDARSDLEAALSRLSRPKRTTLLLAEVEGFSCQEIAEMTSVPIGTVWTRLHSARAELRELLGGEP